MIRSLSLGILISAVSSLALDSSTKAASPADLWLSRAECIPFDLEDRGAMVGVAPLRQYEKNCYAAGSSALISAWLTSKMTAAEIEASGRPAPHLRGLAERRHLSHFSISPQHLAVSYAYFSKNKTMLNPRRKDWKFPRPGTPISEHQEFLSLVRKETLSAKETSRLDSLVKARAFYLNAGDGKVAFLNLWNHSVCPTEAIEGRLKTFSAGKTYLDEVISIYSRFAREAAAFVQAGDGSALLGKTYATLSSLYDRYTIPEEARLSSSEMADALFPHGALEETDPLFWLHEVLMGMCKRSKKYRPINLKAYLDGPTAPRYSGFQSKGPVHSRKAIETYFFGETGSKDPHEMQPLGISYASYAIKHGEKKLEWVYDPEAKRFVKRNRYGGHFSAVVGRRWNAELDRCEYKIRNSVLVKSFAPGYLPSSSPMSYWVKDEFLFRSINRFGYLYDSSK